MKPDDVLPIPSDVLQEVLACSKCNWFECIERLETQFSTHRVKFISNNLLDSINDLDLTTENKQLLLVSHEAFQATQLQFHQQNRTTSMINGDIVTDSESDNPEDYIGLTDVLSEAGKSLLCKRRAAIKRQAQRKKAKAVAEARFLSRRSTHSKQTSEGLP